VYPTKEFLLSATREPAGLALQSVCSADRFDK
jgi:hypothetical protein